MKGAGGRRERAADLDGERAEELVGVVEPRDHHRDDALCRAAMPRHHDQVLHPELPDDPVVAVQPLHLRVEAGREREPADARGRVLRVMRDDPSR